MEELLNLLKDIRPDVDFENETELIDDGILDSMDVVSIISAIDDVFDVQIRITELDPENFNSVENLWALIQSLKK
ncbi:MAG: acyl carrier protein [Bacteroides sp.]|nr:acyl carrier protein [Bacteroides sp.]